MTSDHCRESPPPAPPSRPGRDPQWIPPPTPLPDGSQSQTRGPYSHRWNLDSDLLGRQNTGRSAPSFLFLPPTADMDLYVADHNRLRPVQEPRVPDLFVQGETGLRVGTEGNTDGKSTSVSHVSRTGSSSPSVVRTSLCSSSRPMHGRDRRKIRVQVRDPEVCVHQVSLRPHRRGPSRRRTPVRTGTGTV